MKQIGAKAKDLDDRERIDPGQVQRWYVTGSYHVTVVLATCEEEAKGAAMWWFTRAGLKTPGTVSDLLNRLRARPATEADVDSWLANRVQDRERVNAS